MKYFNFKLTLIFLFSLSVNLLQSHFIISPLDHIYSDMGGYIERATRLANGGPFYPFDTFYPPGTSYFYALVFYLFGKTQGLNILTYLQPLLLSSANILAALTVYQLYASSSAAIFVAILCSLFWQFSVQGSFFMAEALFIFLILLGQYLFIKTLKSRNSRLNYLIIGLIFAAASLVKTQGLCFLISSLATILIFQKSSRLLLTLLLLTGPILCFSLQIAINSSILGYFKPSIAANGAFNTYLGQSRHEAIGCLDKLENTYYLFYNNNSYFDHQLLPPVTLSTSILNETYFHQETLKLWRTNPKLQLIRSLRSVFELYLPYAHWPLRNVKQFVPWDVFCQYFSLIFFIVPAIYGTIKSLTKKSNLQHTFLLLLPILGITAIVFLGSGQPRYLIPFKYNFILLGISSWRK